MPNEAPALVPLVDIVVADDWNIRAKHLIQAKVAEYAENIDALPPVSLFEVGRDRYLVDGWHRMEATRRLGRQTINAVIVGIGTTTDAQDYADGANLRHGLPLTPEQRREILRRFIARHPAWTQREIAAAMNCSQMTVSRLIAVINHNVETNVSNQTTGDKTAASQDDRAGAVSIEAVALKWKQWCARDLTRFPVTRWSPIYRATVKAALQPIVEFWGKL